MSATESSICYVVLSSTSSPVFFFNDTATTEIYTLSLHDALPIYLFLQSGGVINNLAGATWSIVNGNGNGIIFNGGTASTLDRKSTRLNSSHTCNSYAVSCLNRHTLSANAAPPTFSRGVSCPPRPARIC